MQFLVKKGKGKPHRSILVSTLKKKNRIILIKTLSRSYLGTARKNYVCILFSAIAVYSKHIKLYFDFESMVEDIVYIKKILSELVQ